MAVYKDTLISAVEGKLGHAIDADSEENIEFLEAAYYSDLDGTGGVFTTDDTFQENKAQQGEINDTILISLDGYGNLILGLDATVQSHKTGQDQINEDILNTLDGYLTTGSGVTASGGVNTRVAYFTGANTIAGDASFVWDATNNYLGINVTPNDALDVDGYIAFTESLKIVNDVFLSTGRNGSEILIGRKNAEGTDVSRSVIIQDLNTIPVSGLNRTRLGLYDCVVIGYAAGLHDELPAEYYQSTIIGSYAGSGNTSFINNVAVGYRAAIGSVANDCVFVGIDTGGANAPSQSVAIGNKATAGGDNNTVVGYNAGFGANMSDSVIIGHTASSTGTIDNSVIIGGLALDNDTNKLKINAISGAGRYTSASETPLIYGDFDSRYLTIHGYLNVGDGINLEAGRQPTDIDGYGSVWVADDGYLAFRDTSLNEYAPVLATRGVSGDFIVTAVSTSGGTTGSGYIELEASGVKRYIHLNSTP